MYCISFLESVLHCHMLIIDGQIILPCEVKSLYKHCLYKVVSSPLHKILFYLFIVTPKLIFGMYMVIHL